MPHGLKEEHIIKIQSIFAKNPQIQKALLFGSRAKGNFKPGSDIDIALLGNNLNLDDVLKLHRQLDELDLPFKFDLLIYDQINEIDVIEHINRVSVELYEKSNAN